MTIDELLAEIQQRREHWHALRMQSVQELHFHTASKYRENEERYKHAAEAIAEIVGCEKARADQ